MESIKVKLANTMSLNEKAIILSFVYLQAFVFVVAAVVFSSMPERAMHLFGQMPAVGAIYESVGASWIAKLRHFSHGMLALSSFTMGFLVMMVGMKSTMPVLKFLTALLGIQFLSSGLLNSAQVLMLENGGYAHLLATVVGVSVTFTSILTAAMFAMKVKHLQTFRDDADAAHPDENKPSKL